MTNSVTYNKSGFEVSVQKNLLAKNNSFGCELGFNSETENPEMENELEKQKADGEKGAKLVQLIWGDNFLSDSLH